MVLLTTLSAYASGDYSSGGGYAAQQYSVPPPTMATGENYASGGAQGAAYGAQSYGGQTAEWNTQNSGTFPLLCRLP